MSKKRKATIEDFKYLECLTSLFPFRDITKVGTLILTLPKDIGGTKVQEEPNLYDHLIE